MTTHSWDENPTGEWTLEIENVAGASDYGKAPLLCLREMKGHFGEIACVFVCSFVKLSAICLGLSVFWLYLK